MQAGGAHPGPAYALHFSATGRSRRIAMKVRATVLALGLALFATSGCTTSATTHHHSGGSGVDIDVDSDDACHGVWNCTVDLVEDAVMFPFRVLDSIF
jgi:hypothetical protein